MATEDDVDDEVPAVRGRTPWRVLLIGGFFGVLAILFWAYQTDIIRLEQWAPGPSMEAGMHETAGVEPGGMTDMGPWFFNFPKDIAIRF